MADHRHQLHPDVQAAQGRQARRGHARLLQVGVRERPAAGPGAGLRTVAAGTGAAGGSVLGSGVQVTIGRAQRAALPSVIPAKAGIHSAVAMNHRRQPHERATDPRSCGDDENGPQFLPHELHHPPRHRHRQPRDDKDARNDRLFRYVLIGTVVFVLFALASAALSMLWGGREVLASDRPGLLHHLANGTPSRTSTARWCRSTAPSSPR